MESVTVVINTIGSRKFKQAAVSPDENLLRWGQMVRRVIASVNRSLSEAGLEPRILFVDGTKSGLSPAQKQKLLNGNPNVEIIHRPGTGMGEGFFEGLRFASHRGDKNLVTFFDDFEREAKDVAKLALPIVRGKTDYVFGRWEPNAVFSFPLTQVRNEMGISYLVTVANPRFRVLPGESVQAAVQRARKEGTDLQCFSGLLAVNRPSFQRIEDFVVNSIGLSSEAKRVGIEPLLLLGALQTDCRVKGVPVARYFEHYSLKPKSQAARQGFIRGRALQFQDAVACIRRFLEATGQTNKIPLLDNASRQTIARIQQKPPYWKPMQKRRLKRVLKRYR